MPGGDQQGLGYAVAVKKGDTIRSEVFAKYVDLKDDPQLNAMLMAMGALTSSAGMAAGLEGAAMQSGTNNAGNAGVFGQGSAEEKLPKAYLNYILMDSLGKFIDAGYVPVTEEALEDGKGIEHQKLELEHIASADGYLYTFVSNESGKPKDVFFDDLSLTLSSSNQLYYFSKDHLGSTRAVIRDDNTVKARYDYDAYGNIVRYVGEEEIAYRYTGQEFDKEIGLHNYRARYYDAELGRFLAVDPQGQFHNPYNGMGNNPVMNVDPDGEFVLPVIAGISRAHNKSKYAGESSIWEIGKNYAIGYSVSSFNNATSYYGLKNNIPGIQITPQIIEGSESHGVSVTGYIGTNYLGYEYSGAYIHDNKIYGHTGFESTSTFQIGPFYTTKYRSGDFTQRTGGFKGRIPFFAFVELGYENDGTPFQHFPGFTDGKDENGDVHDRWRTASLSAKIGFGPQSFTIGVDLFTGQPDRLNTEDIGLKQQVYANADADKYRHGVLWIGVGNQRIGYNSEGIRNAVQNEFSHNLLKPQPYFRPLTDQFPNRFYYANYRRSRYHYW